MERVRIDKWLWAARFFKTRSLAQAAVEGGRVHVGGARVKPSRELRAGEVVEVTVGDARRTLVVRGISDRRGPAPVAEALYEETSESLARREQERERRRLAAPLGSDLGERPTKRDRRRLEALRKGMERPPG